MIGAMKGPTRLWYLLGLVLMLGAVPVFCLTAFIMVNRSVPDVRFAAPGSHDVHLDGNSTYVVFYEDHSVLDGRTYSTGPYPASLSLRIQSASTAEPVAVRTNAGTSSYGTLQYSGTSILEFDIDQAGTYTFVAEYRDEATPGEIVLAVAGEAPLAEGVGFAVLIVGTVLSILAGAITTLVTLLLRRKASRSTKTPGSSPGAQPSDP